MKKNYTHLLFDADDTILDYQKTEETYLKTVYAAFFSAHPWEDYLNLFYETSAACWQEMVERKMSAEELKISWWRMMRDHFSLNVSAGEIRDFFMEELKNGGHTVKGAKELIESLAGRYSISLITNGFKEAAGPRIEKAGLSPYFSPVITSEEAYEPKPYTGFFDYAMEKLAHPPKEELLVIGDGLLTDIKGASLYSLDSCWFNPSGKPNETPYQPRYEISRLEELLEILN